MAGETTPILEIPRELGNNRGMGRLEFPFVSPQPNRDRQREPILHHCQLP